MSEEYSEEYSSVALLDEPKLKRLTEEVNGDRKMPNWCWRLAAVLKLRRLAREDWSLEALARDAGDGVTAAHIMTLEQGVFKAEKSNGRVLESVVRVLGFESMEEYVREADQFLDEDYETLTKRQKAFLREAEEAIKTAGKYDEYQAHVKRFVDFAEAEYKKNLASNG